MRPVPQDPCANQGKPWYSNVIGGRSTFKHLPGINNISMLSTIRLSMGLSAATFYDRWRTESRGRAQTKVHHSRARQPFANLNCFLTYRSRRIMLILRIPQGRSSQGFQSPTQPLRGRHKRLLAANLILDMHVSPLAATSCAARLSLLVDVSHQVINLIIMIYIVFTLSSYFSHSHFQAFSVAAPIHLATYTLYIVAILGLALDKYS